MNLKLSFAEFRAHLRAGAPSAELSEAEFLAHVILKGVAFNTYLFYRFQEIEIPTESVAS